MSMIRSQLVDRVDEILREEELTDVLGRGIGVARVISLHLGLHSDVDVGSAGRVVAREDGQELANTGLVGLGDSAQEG